MLFFSTPSSSFQQLPEGRTADEAIQELNAAHAAYRRVEASLQAKRTRLLAKLPEISRARAAVAALRESLGEDENEEEETAKSPPIDLDFCVAEQVYSRATLDRRRLREGGVALWLGAGVSVEYKLPEAQALLEANESAAKSEHQDQRRRFGFRPGLHHDDAGEHLEGVQLGHGVEGRRGWRWGWWSGVEEEGRRSVRKERRRAKDRNHKKKKKLDETKTEKSELDMAPAGDPLAGLAGLSLSPGGGGSSSSLRGGGGAGGAPMKGSTAAAERVRAMAQRQRSRRHRCPQLLLPRRHRCRPLASLLLQQQLPPPPPVAARPTPSPRSTLTSGPGEGWAGGKDEEDFEVLLFAFACSLARERGASLSLSLLSRHAHLRSLSFSLFQTGPCAATTTITRR